jgi:hypothetical protein
VAVTPANIRLALRLDHDAVHDLPPRKDQSLRHAALDGIQPDELEVRHSEPVGIADVSEDGPVSDDLVDLRVSEREGLAVTLYSLSRTSETTTAAAETTNEARNHDREAFPNRPPGCQRRQPVYGSGRNTGVTVGPTDRDAYLGLRLVARSWRPGPRVAYPRREVLQILGAESCSLRCGALSGCRRARARWGAGGRSST